MDARGTSPRMDELERSLEQSPRAMHDCMDAGVRATQDAKAEEQLPRTPGATKPESSFIPFL